MCKFHIIKFVQHHLTTSEHQSLQTITRGLPQLRALRAIVEEVYRLFDRGSRTDSAKDSTDRLLVLIHHAIKRLFGSLLVIRVNSHFAQNQLPHS